MDLKDEELAGTFTFTNEVSHPAEVLWMINSKQYLEADNLKKTILHNFGSKVVFVFVFFFLMSQGK